MFADFLIRFIVSFFLILTVRLACFLIDTYGHWVELVSFFAHGEESLDKVLIKMISGINKILVMSIF